MHAPLHLKLALALFGLFSLLACSPKLEYSQKRDVAEQFMGALASGDSAKATALSEPTEENRLAVKLMTEAIQLKIKQEGIKQFSYVYLNDTQTESNKARVVFSQVQDGKTMPDNLVLELVYDSTKNVWMVHNLLLR